MRRALFEPQRFGDLPEIFIFKKTQYHTIPVSRAQARHRAIQQWQKLPPDLIGTFVLLVATTALTLWMAGKIFRIGILRTGQPPKIVEMIRWAFRRQS